ncbi:V-type ATP synthase subunit F [Dactylosporangium sp. NPDC050588]|uniref:V-type ATP synthase subunit F n=1 Tax=Dactylosporangium sp. NPDC050588 TaxID=3157211 RepID=UPI0034100B5C
MDATARVAAIGETRLVRGYGLAGVTVVTAEDERAAQAAWRELDPRVGIVIVTPSAARAVAAAGGPGGRLLAVLPDPDGAA